MKHYNKYKFVVFTRNTIRYDTIGICLSSVFHIIIMVLDKISTFEFIVYKEPRDGKNISGKY